jgi:hypothetical protein
MSMNYTILYSAKDLDTILSEPILITGDMKSHEREIEQNMWAISLADITPVGITHEKLVSFVVSLRNIIRKQLQNNNISSPVTLYMWFDEMAGQLRFNILSGHIVQLPFGCHVEKVLSVEQIIDVFLSSRYLHGISADELEPDAWIDEQDDDDDEQYTLPVYVEYITYNS